MTRLEPDPQRSLDLAIRSTRLLGVISCGFGLVIIIPFGYFNKFHTYRPHFIALGLIKRTVPVDAPLTAAGVAAAQEVIVPPDAGANVQITLRRPRGDLRRSRP